MTYVKSKKILIVDDEPEIRDLLLRILSRKYIAQTAVDGLEALAMTEKIDFDLLLVDLNMPRMSGQELVKAIRERGNSQTAFIILTGHGTFEEAYQLLSDVSISDFLNKPTGRQELLFSVERALREAALMKQLNDNNLNLEAQVKIRTQQLNERNADLFAEKEKVEAASMAKSVFLSRMNHELRTPLNAILGNAQLQTFVEGLPKESQDNNQEILQAGQQLLELVEDILDFTIGVNDLPISIEETSLAPIIVKSINAIKLAAELANVSIHYQELAISVQADPKRLKQVIDNILSNAVKFNHNPGDIYIAVTEHDQQVEITVRDTGVGVPPKDEQTIFEPFARSAYAEDQAISGTGIGLAFCRSLINQMKGCIGFIQQSHGACFYLRLPKAHFTK